MELCSMLCDSLDGRGVGGVCGGLVAKLCLTPAITRTVARQSPLSMGCSRQEYWSGFHSLLQGIFMTQGFNPGLLHCRQILNHWTTREIQLSILNIAVCTCQSQTPQVSLPHPAPPEDNYSCQTYSLLVHSFTHSFIQ